MRTHVTFFAAVLAVGVSVGFAQTRDPEKRPGVSGDWVGTWGVYSPPKDGAPPPPTKYTKEQLRLDCRVAELRDGKWEATFEGECGRPYKYTIKMAGRQVGDVVLFQGSADLGEKDGGVYDWIGRATADEFIGFYTSQKYTGHFRLARPKESKPAAPGPDKNPEVAPKAQAFSRPALLLSTRLSRPCFHIARGQE